jgi:hypothetical protein
VIRSQSARIAPQRLAAHPHSFSTPAFRKVPHTCTQRRRVTPKQRACPSLIAGFTSSPDAKQYLLLFIMADCCHQLLKKYGRKHPKMRATFPTGCSREDYTGKRFKAGSWALFHASNLVNGQFYATDISARAREHVPGARRWRGCKNDAARADTAENHFTDLNCILRADPASTFFAELSAVVAVTSKQPAIDKAARSSVARVIYM